MPALRKYPDELRERAVRMVLEIRAETGTNCGAVVRVAERLGINKETLRGWVNQADVDHGRRPGLSTTDAARVAELEAEVKDLRRANEILRTASIFFAGELDPRSKR